MTATNTRATAVADTFTRTVGRAPEGVWAAPGRVNLIGDHTDYNDGLSLPIAINRRTYAAAARRDDRTLVLRSSQETGREVSLALADLAPGVVDGWAAYAAGVLWALHEEGHEVGGLDLVVDGQVPIGAGLSSSASLECVTAVAAAELFALAADPVHLALAAQRAENEFVGVPCGLMDQMASMTGVAGHALLFDARATSVRPVPFAPEEHDLTLLVIDSRVSHALGDSGYADRRSGCERAARALGVAALRDIDPGQLESALTALPAPDDRRVRHVVTEIARVQDAATALAADDWRELGRLMTQSHESLRDDYEVSCPELDLSVDTALAAGALGARMTGGGFGGSAVALVPHDLEATVAVGLLAAFHQAGLSPPGLLPAVASASAGRVA